MEISKIAHLAPSKKTSQRLIHSEEAKRKEESHLTQLPERGVMKSIAFLLLLATTTSSNAEMIARVATHVGSTSSAPCEGEPMSVDYKQPMQVTVVPGSSRRINCETNTLQIDTNHTVSDAIFNVDQEIDLGECMIDKIAGDSVFYERIECADLGEDGFFNLEAFESCSDRGTSLILLEPTDECRSSSFYDDDVLSFQASCSQVPGKLVIEKWTMNDNCSGNPDAVMEISTNEKCDPSESVVATCGSFLYTSSSAAAVNNFMFVLPLAWLLLASYY